MPRKKNTCMYLVAALLFLGGLGYLVFSDLSENTVYFLNVSEARAATADKLQAARLFGTVAPDNLLKNVDGPGASFLLSVFLWPETKKGSAFPQTLISFLVELRRIELLTS